MNRFTGPAILTAMTAAAVLVPIAGHSLAQKFQNKTAPAAVQITPGENTDTPSTRMSGAADIQVQPWEVKKPEKTDPTARNASAQHDGGHKDNAHQDD